MTGILPYCAYIGFACIAGYLHYKGIDGSNLLILVCFYLADIFTGISKSYTLRNKYPEKKRYYPDGRVMNDWFSTNRLIKGFTDKFIGLLVPFIVFGLGTVVGFDPNKGYDIILALSVGAEFISIIQNIYISRTGEAITEFDAWTFMMKFIVKQSAVVFRGGLQYMIGNIIRGLKFKVEQDTETDPQT